MPQSLEQLINMARQRIVAGEKLSLAEQAELVKAIRAGRHAAAEVGAAARTKGTAKRKAATGASDDEVSSDLDDLLGDL